MKFSEAGEPMDTGILKKYAKLLAISGLNVQPGQEVVIRTAPEQLDFVEMLMEECYKAGAKKVVVDWRYQPFTKLAVEYQDDETLGTVDKWEEEKLRHRAEVLPAMIYLYSEDPDGLSGMDQDKWMRAQRSIYKVTEQYQDAMENKYQWCVAAVPGEKWAQKVFPGLGADEAEEKLWEAILSCSRALGDDPVADWREHDKTLRRRCDKLNELNLVRLIYKSESTGTDFNVGLIPECLFMGGNDVLSTNGADYNANIPTEEVFTTPMKGDAEGIVYGTMPFSYRGVLIEDFSIRFEKGRVVEVKAAKNEDVLRKMVEMDEGAAMLGECALVPYHSPINESGILFYNTLFDENASCHLALGRGYMCFENPEQYTPEQARELGVNNSMIHEDFMIGSADLCIKGITADGSEVLIFKDGEFVID